MKKFTLFIALMAFMAVNVFGQPTEVVSSDPTWDGSNQIDLCLGGSFVISITNTDATHTYNIAQAGSKAIIRSMSGNGGTINFSAVTPVLGNTSYTAYDATDGTPWVNFTANVVAQPTPPTMTKTPNSAAVCAGTNVSAAIASAGSGGVTSCADIYEYRTNGGAWLTYNPGTNISTTTGVSSVDIQAYRADPQGRGCMSTVNTYSWTVNALPSAPTAGDLTVCFDNSTHTASASVGTFETVDWYAAASGTTTSSAPSNSAVGTYQAYADARVIATGCVSATRTLVTLTINAVPDTPTGTDVTVCYDGNTYTGTATLVTGDVIVWYDASSGGNVTTAPSGSAVGIYTAYAGSKFTATGCESANRLQVTVTINALPDTPTGTDVTVCYDGNTYTGTATLVTGDEIVWYDASSGGNVTTVPSGSAVGIYTAYAGSKFTATECESANRLQVTVTINALPDTPTGTDVTVCYDGNTHTGTATLVTGDEIVWYDASSGGNVTTVPSGSAVGIYTAYAGSKFTATGCESANRLQVTVTINALPDTPTGTDVTVCYDGNTYTGTATLVTGDEIVWYDASSGGNVTTVPSGSAVGIYTAYAGSKFTATECESANRLQVTVTINALPDTPTGTDVTVCYDGNTHTGTATLVTGDEIVWYDASSGGNVTTVPSGSAVGIYTAYAGSKFTATGCESANRLQVTVTINALPDTPTGTDVTVCYDGNTYTGTATLVTGDEIVWYDASSGGNVTTAPSGSAVGTYIAWAAAHYTATGCESDPRREVTVTINALPNAPTDGSVTACWDGNEYTGSAGVGSGEEVVWYDASTGGNITVAPSQTDVGSNSAWAEAKITATGCVSTTRTEVTVTIDALPTPDITGTTPVCAHTEYTYTTDPGEDNYSWSVSIGGAITGGGGILDNYVDITWGATGAGSVFVNYDDATTGCSAINPTKYVVTNSGPVHNTDQDIYYCKIQDAIDDADPGETIVVAADEFPEQLLIQKDLILTGAGIGQTIVKAPSSGRVTAPGYTGANWTADNWTTDYLLAAYPTDPISGTPISVKVTGFTFDANGQSHIGNRYTGVYFRKVFNSTITDAGLFNSEIKGFATSDPSVTGIRVLESSKLNLYNNLVKDYTILGIVVYGTNNLVDPYVITSNNTLTPYGNAAGIQYRYINGTLVSGEINSNTITGGSIPIAASYSDHVIIDPNVISNSSNVGILLEASHYCTVEDNIISNSGSDGIQLTAGSSDNDILGNDIDNSGSDGIQLSSGSSSNNDILGNDIDDFGSSGIKLLSGSSYNQIQTNNIDDGGAGNYCSNGIALSGAGNNTISGNIISNINYSAFGNTVADVNAGNAAWGIAFYSTSNNNTATGNDITLSDVGIENWEGTDNVATGNKIYGNFFGLHNNTTTTMTAENNWWGHASGPNHDPNNTCGLGDPVSDYVDFMPWWTNDAGGTGTLAVNNTTKGTYYCTIQDAIDDASAYNVINVSADTYTETLNITTAGLHIIGIGTVIIDPEGKATNNAGIYVNAANVTLEGFTLDPSGASSTPRYGIKFGIVDGCTLEDVTVQTAYRSGVDALGTSNLTINNVFCLNNGGHGLSLVDCNGVDITNTTLAGNGWEGVSVATWGRYSPLGTSDIVFGSGNTYTDVFQIEMGDYNNPGDPPAGAAIITYSTNIADGADVTVQSSDFGFAVHGEQDDSPDQVRIWFFETLAEAKSSVATPGGHFTGNDMYIEDLVNDNEFYVSSGGTIQAAINAATTGGVINVDPEPFTENLDVNTGVTLKGANYGIGCTGSRGNESIINGGTGTAVDITANGVTIDGFTILGATGIQDQGYEAVDISNNIINAGGLGIGLSGLVTTTTPDAGLTVQNNCINITAQVVLSTETNGIVLSDITGTKSISVDNNKIYGSYYGYVIAGVLTTPKSTISNGTITGVMQGVFVLNLELTTYTNKPVNVGLDGLSMSSFTGDWPAPATPNDNNFHAGVYVYSGGSSTADKVTLTINDVSVDGTQKIQQDCAGLYFGDFSTATGTMQDITVTACTLVNNINRGIFVTGANADVSISSSTTLTNNGGDPFGASGNDGFGILAKMAATVAINGCTITNPATQAGTYGVWAMAAHDNSTMNAHNCLLYNNGNTDGVLAQNTGNITFDASENYWGSATPDFNTLVVGDVTVCQYYTDDALTTLSCAPVTNVTQGTVYYTIQAAVDAANAANPTGDVITVVAGYYTGAIVDKDVNIIGAVGGGSIIDVGVPYKTGSGLTTAFRFDDTADGAEIRNFTVNCDAGTSYYFAVFARNADGITVDELIVNDAVQGISNYGGSNWIITNNDLFDTQAAGGGGIAILLSTYPPDYTVCSGNLIQYNTIQSAATAPDYSTPGIFMGLDLRYGRYALLTGSEDLTGNQILDNDYTCTGLENEVGIEIGVLGLDEDPVKIAATLGIIHDNTVSSNTIGTATVGPDYGMYFYTVKNLTVTDNEIQNCAEVGVYITDGNQGNLVNNNNFIDNAIGVDNASGSTLDATLNWWGHASGPSGEGPGIGDEISTKVDFCPWLDDLFDAVPLPDLTYLVNNTISGEGFCTIQEAIDAATTLAGHVIQISKGVYPEHVALNKDLTLTGAGEGLTVLDGTGLGTGNGITLSNGLTGVTIEHLTIQNYTGSGSSGSGIFGVGNSNFILQHVTLDNCQGRGGIYLSGSGGIDNVFIDYVTSSNHVGGCRGIVIWGGYKTNITITNCEVFNNNCCGIELQDGTASNVTITDNNVYDNADSGLGLMGMTDLLGSCLVDDNTVTNNGRFGIEIKNPNGGVTVSNNVVSFVASTLMNNRDHGGIVVYRRAFESGNPSGYADVPNGVTITGNTVSGYTQLSSGATTSEGFGIVVEGVDHTVTGNILDGNDVALQLQGGGHPNPNYTYDDVGDGDQSDGQSAFYFGRGNTPYMCNITVGTNTFGVTTANGIDTRMVIEPLTPITDAGIIASQMGVSVVLDDGTTQTTYCSIQGAVDRALGGQTPEETITASASTFVEDVSVNKSLTILGQGPASTIVQPTAPANVAFTVSVDDVTIKDLKITEPTGLANGIQAVSPASTGLWVENVHFTNFATIAGNSYGINIMNSFSDLDVIDCEFISPATGVYTRGSGVFAPNSLTLNDFDITGSTFKYLFTGIYLRSAIDDLYVYDNTFGPFETGENHACVAGVYIGDGDDNNFDIENILVTENDFINYGRGVYVWNYGANSNIDNFEISGNTFTNSIWSSGIRFIIGINGMEDYYIDGDDDDFGILINDNEFTQNSDFGGNVALVDFRTYDATLLSCNISVTDNSMIFTGSPYTDAMYGIRFLVGGDGFYNTTVSGNTLNGGNTGGTGNPASTGINVYHYATSNTWTNALDIDVLTNKIGGFDYGVGIYDADGATYGGLPAGSDLDINENDLSGNNLYGVAYGVGETVDATCNWWGTEDAYDVEAETSGDVQFLPYLVVDNVTGTSYWWDTGDNYSCDGIGPVKVYDGDPLVLGTLQSSHMTIQDGIDAAVANDFVDVDAGIYPEYLHINKDDLTIQGAGIDQSIIDLDGLIPYWHYSPNGSFASRAGVLFSGWGSPDDIIEDITFNGFTVKNAGLNPPITEDGLADVADPTGTLLTDGTASFPTDGSLVGQWVHNVSDKLVSIDISGNTPIRSYGQITANTATTITATLAGGLENDWDIGDTYVVIPYEEYVDVAEDLQDDVPGIGIHNGKDVTISYCKVIDNGSGGIGASYARNTSSHNYSEGVTIDHCQSLDNAGNGISIGKYVGAVTITYNICSDNGSPHPTDPSREFMGVGITVSGLNAGNPISGDISYNTCDNNGFEGIVLKDYSDGVTIEGNTVTDHNRDQDGAGIFFYGKSSTPSNCDNHIIRDNEVTGNIRGIVAYYAENCTIGGINAADANTITTNSGSFPLGQGGIKLDGANNMLVQNNTLSSLDGIGIKVQNTWNDVESYNNTITKNTITGAQFAGIPIWGGAHDNTFTNNTITGTTVLTFWAGETYEETQADGVFLDDDAGTGNVFHYNSIYGNAGDGMENQVTTTIVDAEDNWWGGNPGDEALGPYHDPNNTCGTGNAVSDNVDFYQWWDSQAMTNLYTLPAPTITCQSNQTRCADETATDTYTTLLTEFDPTVVDNCRPTTMVNNVNSLATLDGYTFSTGTTTVTWTITDVFGNDYLCEFDVFINPLPDPAVAGNATPTGGSTEVYTTTNVSGNTYSWVVTGDFVPGSVFPAANSCEVEWKADGLVGTVEVTETITGTGCNYSDVLNIVIDPIDVIGTLTYKNSSSTPMNNVIVRLTDGGSFSATTTTDGSGNFNFDGLSNGVTYTLEVETAKAWGGGNSTDALAIQRTAIGHIFSWWLPKLFVDDVADVNNSGGIFSSDALLVKKRTVYLINSFAAGDWAFWDGTANFTNTADNIANTSYTYNGSSSTLDIDAMCYGDVNGSFLPSSSKSWSPVPGEDVLDILVDNTFNLPVQMMGSANELGAMTIHLTYDDYLIDIVELNSTIPGLIYNIEEGWIDVAWSELDPLTVTSGDILFTLVAQANEVINEYDDVFMISSESQFADFNCKVLDNLYLSISKLNAKQAVGIEELEALYSLSCFPNPVKNSTNITYTLPENGKVQLIVINQYGKLVTELIDEVQETGNYSLNFNPGEKGLSTGIYYLRMVVEGENSNYNNVIRVVFMK